MEKAWNAFTGFLKKKNIEFSAKRYLKDGLSAMALGLFASLLIGLILKTLGTQITNLAGENVVCNFLIEVGAQSMALMGAVMGVAIAWGLKSPILVMLSSAISGMIGAKLGGPAGAFVAVAIGAEFGKAVSKETKVDIIVTPIVTIVMGCITGYLVGPLIGKLMTGIGQFIMYTTELTPFSFGIIVSVVMGLCLTAPISSAALCMMLDLSGLAAGAATVGCCAQMVGFAVCGYKDNGWGGVVAQGLGTSMLQISNIIRNPWILVPPTLAGAILGPVSTMWFKMENNPMGAGMGTSGLVGQIGTFTTMGMSFEIVFKVLFLHIILPAVLAYFIDFGLRKLGKIHDGDYKLEI